MDTLTAEQRRAFNALREGKNVFLTGSGGTGKSYLINQIYSELPHLKPGINIRVTALTGCAAIIIGTYAKTIHSWAGIALGKGTVAELVTRIRKNARAKKNWMSTNLLVIDEISMMSPELLEKLDQIGRILRRTPGKSFGGIQLLLCGDFLQLPPIMKGIDMKFAFESTIWNDVIDISIELTHIQRQQDDAFRRVLCEARKGQLSEDSVKILKTRMNLDWKGLRIRPTLLFPRRAEVDIINDVNLKALEGVRYTYKAGIDDKAVIGFNSKSEDFIQFLAYFDKDASYLTELVLGMGAQVMLIKNMDCERKLVNGSRGVVVDFMNDVAHTPIVEFMNGMRIPIEIATWEMDGYKGICRTQIPLRLAYAITTHKSQGANLDCALIDIGNNVFEYGQAYVALSRVRSLEGLYIYDFDPDAIVAHPRVLAFYTALQNSNILWKIVDTVVDPVDPVVDSAIDVDCSENPI